MIIDENSNGWSLINYRNVDNLVAVEFLHGLYNQHDYTVNSLRFNNTLCIYSNNEFYSYAPKHEWDQIAVKLGRRYLNLDGRLINATYSYIRKDHNLLLDLLETIENNLNSLINEEAIEEE